MHNEFRPYKSKLGVFIWRYFLDQERGTVFFVYRSIADVNNYIPLPEQLPIIRRIVRQRFERLTKDTSEKMLRTIGSGHRSKRSSSSSNWSYSILEWRTSGLVHGWTSTFHCDRAICELSPLGHRNCSLALLTVTTDSQFVRNGGSLLDAV